MDFITVLTAVTSSLGISVATVVWLSKKILSQQFSKNLENYKNKLEQEKASWQGKIRQEVDLFLGEQAANREYELEARKRLYRIIGPLKFQLLLACRDVEHRITNHGLRESYSTDINSYYGKSTLYRILRPLAITQLIERQITYADFSVDPSALNLLRFKKGAFTAFTSSTLIGNHSKANWLEQKEHVFFDNLSKAANALILQEDNIQRIMYFHEFETFLKDTTYQEKLTPFPKIFKTFQPDIKPVFWLRLVAFGYLCNHYINENGSRLGFEKRLYQIRNLLIASKDQEIVENIDNYQSNCQKLSQLAL